MSTHIERRGSVSRSLQFEPDGAKAAASTAPTCFRQGCIRAGLWLVLFFVTLPMFGSEESGVSASQFDAQAFAALPAEKPYAFLKALSEDGWQLRRDPDAKPRPDEMALTGNGWAIIIKSGASEPLLQAADDLREYLGTA